MRVFLTYFIATTLFCGESVAQCCHSTKTTIVTLIDTASYLTINDLKLYDNGSPTLAIDLDNAIGCRRRVLLRYNYLFDFNNIKPDNFRNYKYVCTNLHLQILQVGNTLFVDDITIAFDARQDASDVKLLGLSLNKSTTFDEIYNNSVLSEYVVDTGKYRGRKDRAFMEIDLDNYRLWLNFTDSMLTNLSIL